MLLILFKILISDDDMQNDTSEIYATVIIEVLRNSQNWAKNTPFELRQRFCQIKEDLMKIYICGNFHQCRIFGCEVKRFFLSYWFSSHEMAPFGGFWALTCWIFNDLAEILTRVGLLIFFWSDQEKMRDFHGSCFSALEFIQFCRISRWEAMFCLEFPRVKLKT